MERLILIAFLLASSEQALARDGYDFEKGTYIEIDQGNLVRQGETIEIFDYSDGEYKEVD